MASEFKPTEKETLPLQDAIDVDKGLENKTKNPAQGETHVFQMPNIENGVTNIGDLWDGRRSEALRHNILKTNKFSSKLLQASPINKCDIKFRQIKSHEDKIESLHIDANTSLEFLFGKIKLEGPFTYDNSTASERSVDGILYNYLNEQYKIQLIPRIKQSLLNRDVENMLKRGIIKATHVVGGMIIGAEVTAWIEVTDTRSKRDVKMDGKGLGKLIKGVLECLGSLSGGADAKESVTNTNNPEVPVKVSVTARPTVDRSPTSLNEFLPFIQNLSKDLAKHIHFSHISTEIFGVPIRFILYPISQYADLEIETLYQELTDSCQKDFIGVIAKCNDLQHAGCVWKIILERNHQLHFLQDSKSEFFQKIDSFEKEIREFARDVLSRSRKALWAYKSGESDMDDIENILREFDRNDASSVQEKAIQMADEGTKELQLAYFDATDEGLKSKVKRFTDRNECDIWLGKSNPRLLLEIKPPCSEAIVTGFLDAAKHLVSLEVDVAIAMPSISEGACLTLKCNERSEKLEGPVLIKALGVLNAVVDEEYSRSHTFYKVIGSLCSIRIPLCQNDIGYLDNVLQMVLDETYGENREREVCFVRSMSDLSTELARSQDRVVICLPLRAPDTDLAVVKQFRSLAKQDAFSNLQWIFCSFEVNNLYEAPLLLIVIKSEIVAVCLDNLDILILMDILNSKSADRRSNFGPLTLTPTRFANTLHPERAHYTLDIMSRVNSSIRLPKSKISGFQNELYEESLKHLMMVIRATLQNDNAHLASAVAALVTGTFQSLSPTSRKNGLHAINENIGSAHFELVDCDCEELMSELEKWKNDHSFETIVQETQQQLVELQYDLVDGSDSSFNAVLRRIMSHDHCPIVVRTQLARVISNCKTLKAKCTEVSNILNIDLLKEIIDVGCGHINALIKVLQKSSQKELSPETIGQLAYLYSRRSTAVTENAMVEDELTRFLMPYQPYHILNTLHPLKHGQVMRLYKALEDLDSLDNSDAVVKIINTAWDVLNQSNSEVLWKNEQWLFLVRHCLENQNTRKLIDSLIKWKIKSSETGLFPTDILDMCQQYNTGEEIVSGNRTAKINDDINGHKYCFQTCGYMYHSALGENLKSDDLQEKLIKPYAEKLMAGKAIELINGDSGEIPLAFFQSICRTVSQIRPGMRVFVMTLFELRISQRSSLVSALFSCKYAISVERHNIRSLFLRIIPLHDSIREAYGYDAIIVLNTESLRSQEVITSYKNDRYDVSRDSFSTIFAISLSNLTVIDEALCNEQIKGFEIVTEAMVALSEVSVLPDLLISRSLNDKTALTEPLSRIIDKAIRKQLDRVDDGDTRVDYADQLKNKFDNGTIYMNVPDLGNSITVEIPNDHSCERMHEDVTNLCVSLLRRSNSRGHKFTFEYWSQLLPSSWNCRKGPLYCLQLREAKEFHELTYYGKQVATAKELLTRTFLQHRNAILKQVRKKYLKGFSAAEICQQLETIPSHCIDKDCISCLKSASYRDNLYLAVKDTAWQDIVRISFQNHRKSLFESMKNLFEMDIKELVSRKNIAQNISKQITDELQNIRKKCPHGIFKHAETSVQVDAIWTQLLTSCAKDENDTSEEEQFALVVDELFPECKNAGLTGDLLLAGFKTGRSIEVNDAEDADIILQSVVKDDTSPLTVPKLIQIITHSQDIARKRQVQTVPAFKDNFNNLHVFKLSSEINLVMSKFLNTKRFDCYRAGIKFELVMLHEFNDHIMIILGKFSEKFKLSISDDVKTVLQINILKLLFDRIMDLQKRWNCNNGAFSILQQGATNYKMQISARLTSGFSNQAEGKLAARYLIMLMRQKIIKDEYDDKIASFLRIPWVANSETVRLRYFETLALEVFAGKKETALEHFRNPQASITKWYKDAAHDHCSEYAEKRFSSTLFGCLQEIRDCKDYSDIDKIIRKCESSASGTYKYERFQTEGDDFEKMLESLKSELTQYSPSNDFETLPDIWENSGVRFRLGCTEECFRCGALCWNYLGHSDDEGELRKHYACHQARGLSPVSAGENTELLATPCCQVSGPHGVAEMPLSKCCGDLSLSRSESVSWKEIESDVFSDWKFQKNIVSRYDDLMRWFFQELHMDIAREKNLRPPNELTLIELCYCKLKLTNILAAIRDEIN